MSGKRELASVVMVSGGVGHREALWAVRHVVAAMVESLDDLGDSLRIHGLGTFRVVEREAQHRDTATDPIVGAQIPQRLTVFFKPSKTLRTKLNQES